MRNSIPLAIGAICAACSFAPSTTSESISSDRDTLIIRSRDWIQPNFNDVYAQVEIKRIGERLHVFKATLDRPLHPGLGTDPTSFIYFEMCLALKLVEKNGYDGYSFGSSDPSRSIIGVREHENLIGLLKNGETPSVFGRADIKWDEPVFGFAHFAKTCEKILQPRAL